MKHLLNALHVMLQAVVAAENLQGDFRPRQLGEVPVNRDTDTAAEEKRVKARTERQLMDVLRGDRVAHFVQDDLGFSEKWLPLRER